MKVAFLYNAIVNYFFFKNSSTASGAIIDSTNVYAPVLGDFTILMAFDNLLEDVCKDATVFFAMILVYLYFNISPMQTSKIILKSLIII
jgi:hypothetical protein